MPRASSPIDGIVATCPYCSTSNVLGLSLGMSHESPGAGKYVGAKVVDGAFHAWVNPITPSNTPTFLSFVERYGR